MNIAHEIERRHLLQEEFLGAEKHINRIVPLVSVTTTTYQHQPYIEDCIKGVLAQITSFPIEFIIGEDGSTDGTREICEKYAEAYPDKIRLFLRDREISQLIDKDGNLIKRLNGAFNRMSARGKYIALCEGDDYWTDPLKLQKQLDFLEDNADVVMTFGNAIIVDLTESYHRKNQYIRDELARRFYPKDVVGLGAPTLTMFYRREKLVYPDWAWKVTSGDYFLRLLLSTTGNFYYHGEIFGVHRKHSGGVSRVTNKMLWNLSTASGLKSFYAIAEAEQKQAITERISSHRIHAFFNAFVQKNYQASLRLGLRMLASRGFYTRKGVGTLRYLITEVFIKKNVEYLDIF